MLRHTVDVRFERISNIALKWIYLAQDKDKQRAVSYNIINRHKSGNFMEQKKRLLICPYETFSNDLLLLN
jgi:ribosomal protein S7